MKKDLTPRELKVFKLIAEGLSSKEIAMLLGNSEKTIEVYRWKLFRKTNSKNVAQLVAFGFRNNLIK